MWWVKRRTEGPAALHCVSADPSLIIKRLFQLVETKSNLPKMSKTFPLKRGWLVGGAAAESVSFSSFLHQAAVHEAAIRLVATRYAHFTFCDKLRDNDGQRLARDTPTHASCTSSTPHLSTPPCLGWLAARPRKSSSRRRQQPSALTRAACLGYFQLPPGLRMQVGGAGVEGIKKKEKKRKAEAPTPVSSCIVLVSRVTPEETFHKCIKKEDRLKTSTQWWTPVLCFPLDTVKNCSFWSQWTQKPIDVWGY